jgi:serine protease Do
MLAAASILALGVATYALLPSQAPAKAPPMVNSRLATDRPSTVPQSMAQVQMTFAPVVKRVAPAVVNVYTRSVVQQPVNPFFNDPFFRQFFGAQRRHDPYQQPCHSGRHRYRRRAVRQA